MDGHETLAHAGGVVLSQHASRDGTLALRLFRYQARRLYTLDSRTGELVRSGRSRMADHASLIATPNGILMLADDGTLTVCRHEQPALQKVESYIVAEGETWSHPVVSSGHLVIKDTDSLSVWRLKSDTASAVSSRR